MKRKPRALSGRYLAALRHHLKRSPGGSLEPARGLGREAVALGLGTLDLARIHEAALAVVGGSREADGKGRRAKIFFTEANTAIEQTHRAALKANARLDQVNRRLDRRTLDLAASHRSLEQSIVRRKTAQRALEQSGGHSRELLEESRRLQQHLRQLAHQILAAQENKRRGISRDLQDEIAQLLLGINVRLLTLRKEAVLEAKGFEAEVTTTRRLVDESIASIKRFARELAKREEA